MNRKWLLLFIMIVLLVGESVYFGRNFVSGYQQLRGRQAFINSEFGYAWEAYEGAARWGGDRVTLDGEILDLLVFNLLQGEAGISLDLPISRDESLSLAWSLVARLLRETPYEAHAWMKYADLRFHEARRVRRERPLDLSALSEDSRQNMVEDEVAAVEALGTAASLEPNNYFYYDLLASFFMEIGAMDEAAPYVRNSVSSYPRLDGHIYLTEGNLPEPILEAAIAGIQDAIGKPSLARKAETLVDAGRLLFRWNDAKRALSYLEQAVALAPDLYDAHYRLGQVLSRTGEYRRSIEHFRMAAELLPTEADPHYYIGLAYQALGELPAAIESLSAARQKRPDMPGFRYALGEVLEAADRITEAQRQYVSAANLRPDDPGAWLELIRFYSRTGQHASVLESCGRLARLDSGHNEYEVYCASPLRKDAP